MTKPVLLLFDASAERMLGEALTDRFEVLRLWQADAPDRLLAEHGADVVATFTLRFEAALLELLPNLRLIAVPGAGYDRIDVAAARARGVRIASAGSTHSRDVADHAVALVLAAVHRLPEMERFVRDGRWRAGAGHDRRHAMSAQRFGIVGLGNIGTAIGERLAVFGGEISWWGPRTKAAAWPRRTSLLDLAGWCTTLILATRGDAAGLIDARIIAAVGPEGRIVNIARGAVVDEDALIAALKDGRLGQAALDVFAEEPGAPERWCGVPNVILTPHIGGVSHEAFARLREAAIRNLTSVLDGGPLVNEIMA